MQLSVHPNGDSGASPYMSACLYIMKGPHDKQLEWPMKGKCEVKLLNQTIRSEEKHYSRTNPINEKNSCKPTSKRNEHYCWHSGALISYETLTARNHFLKEDTIYFKVCSLQ